MNALEGQGEDSIGITDVNYDASSLHLYMSCVYGSWHSGPRTSPPLRLLA